MAKNPTQIRGEKSDSDKGSETVAVGNTPSKFLLFPSAVTTELCNEIIKTCEIMNLKPGTVNYDTGEEIDEAQRKDNIVRIPVNSTYNWLYDEVWRIIQEVNENNWKFKITSIEALQYSKYTAGDHFDWHRDNLTLAHRRQGQIPTEDTRKISLTIQLSEPSHYEGGYFEIYSNQFEKLNSYIFENLEKNDQRRQLGESMRPKGSLILFPSFFLHRVTPIHSGTRLSLVAWGIGPPDDYDSY